MPGSPQVVAAAGGTPVLADLKTADDARTEFTLAYDAGAASATVLGLAADVTLDTAVRVAAERGREVVVDLMELRRPRRAALAAGCREHVVLAAHVPRTPRRRGLRPATCSARGPPAAGSRWRADSPLPTCPRWRDLSDVRVIVGSAVTKAATPWPPYGNCAPRPAWTRSTRVTPSVSTPRSSSCRGGVVEELSGARRGGWDRRVVQLTPAAPDDPHPGAGEDAHGVRVVLPPLARARW